MTALLPLLCLALYPTGVVVLCLWILLRPLRSEPETGRVERAGPPPLSRLHLCAIVALLLGYVAIAVGPAAARDRFHFADTEVLAALDARTDLARRPLSELGFLSYFRHSKDLTQVTRPLNKRKYRPLADMGYVLKYYAVRNLWPYTGLLVNAVAMFLAGLAVFLLAREACPDPFLQALAPGLVLLSPILLSLAYLNVHTEDSLILFLTGFAAYAFFRYQRTGSRGWFFVAAVLCLLGPFYKEPTKILPPILLVAELHSPRRSAWTQRILAFLALNSIYPSLLVNLFLFGDFIGARFTAKWMHPRTDPYFPVVQHLIGHVPPTLLVLSFLGLASFVLRWRRSLALPNPRERSDWLAAFLLERATRLRSSPWGPTLLSSGALLAVAALLGGLLVVFLDPFLSGEVPLAPADPGGVHPLLPFFAKSPLSILPFLAMLLAAGLTYFAPNPALRLVALWFAACTGGMARYYLIDHHLMFLLAPFVVLLAFWLHLAGGETAHRMGVSRARACWVLRGLVLLLAAEGALQSWNVAMANASIHETQTALLRVLTERPVHLVTNSKVVDDARFLASSACASGSYAFMSEALRTPVDPSCEPRPVEVSLALFRGVVVGLGGTPVLTEPEQLAALRARLGPTPLLFVTSTRSQWPFWPATQAEEPAIAPAEDVIARLEFDTPILYVDPLRRLLPLMYSPRPMPADFYREVIPEHDGWFRQRMRTTFEVRRAVPPR